MTDWSHLIGVSYEAARASATGFGIKVLRICRINGRPTVGTRDYRTDRLNIAVERRDGLEVVTAIIGIG